jgi:hypothetical protein
LYYGYKQAFDADETLMTVLKAKKDNLTKK